MIPIETEIIHHYVQLLHIIRAKHAYVQWAKRLRKHKRTRDGEQDRDARSHTSAHMCTCRVMTNIQQERGKKKMHTRKHRWYATSVYKLNGTQMCSYFHTVFLVTVNTLRPCSNIKAESNCTAITEPFACLLTPFRKVKNGASCIVLSAL